MRYEADVIYKNIIKKRKIQKIFFIILYIILVPTILFSLLLILLELGNSFELPSFLNIEMYTVISNSMEPKLSKDDIVIVKKGYINEKYKIGNIITFKREDGEIITHRIKKDIFNDGQRAYITQGDNNDTEDKDIVKYEMIIGKVIYTMPRFGNLMKILKNKMFFSICIVSLIVIILFDRKQKQKKIERKITREKYEKKSDFYF